MDTRLNISMFGHQTMFDGVWSPNIYRLSRPLLFDLCLIKQVLTIWPLTSTLACLVTKQCLLVFGRQTFLVCPGPCREICHCDLFEALRWNHGKSKFNFPILCPLVDLGPIPMKTMLFFNLLACLGEINLKRFTSVFFRTDPSKLSKDTLYLCRLFHILKVVIV